MPRMPAAREHSSSLLNAAVPAGAFVLVGLTLNDCCRCGHNGRVSRPQQRPDRTAFLAEPRCTLRLGLNRHPGTAPRAAPAAHAAAHSHAGALRTRLGRGQPIWNRPRRGQALPRARKRTPVPASLPLVDHVRIMLQMEPQTPTAMNRITAHGRPVDRSRSPPSHVLKLRYLE